MESKENPTKNYNQSALMSAFNFARWWGRRTGLTTDERCNKALHYLMNGEVQEKWGEYNTTIKNCGCKDSQFRPEYFCNHIISKMIDVKHDQIMQQEIWQYQKAA